MTDLIGELVQQHYRLAKSGDWNKVLSTFDERPTLASVCSRYRKSSSGWTFLHQTAYWGHEGAARVLIRLGASITIKSNDGETASDVAIRRGHEMLSRLIEVAARRADGLWEPPPDPTLLPSSSAWEEGIERRASCDMRVAYGGGIVVIPSGGRYFVDSFERTLVGWHGTYDPPSGMDAESML